VSGDEAAQLVAGVMMLVLVGSGLIARRLPLNDVLRMTLGWVLVFALLLVGYSYRAELGRVVQRVTGDLLGDRGQTAGGTLRVPMAEDGHFWVRARVNGIEMRFMIDSGATTTVMSSAAAMAAGVSVDQSGFPVVMETANGTARAYRARVERLVLGPIESSDLAVLVSPTLGDTNLLGMNFLSSLESWRVEGRTLVLEPRSPANQ
jgi:aspartyl protease family protein